MNGYRNYGKKSGMKRRANTFKKKQYSARSLPAAIQMAAALRAGKELKGVDTNLAVGTVTDSTNSNTDAVCLNLMAAGVGSFNRIGRKINLRSTRLKVIARLTSNELSTTSGNLFRMVVVWDKQPAGVLPQFDEIFGNTVAIGTETSTVLDSLRYDNTDRFSVLSDTVETFQVNSRPTQVAGPATARFYFDKFIDLHNRESVYSGSGSAITDLSSGGVYVYFRSQDQGTTTTIAIEDNSVARTRYTD